MYYHFLDIYLQKAGVQQKNYNYLDVAVDHSIPCI